MKTQKILNLTAWMHASTIDPMIGTVAGIDLTRALTSARSTREALGAALNLDQRTLYILASDAAQDAVSIRERAVEHVALVHGLAVGAALAAFPDEPHDLLVDVATRIAGATIGAGMDTEKIQRIVARVLGAVERAQG